MGLNGAIERGKSDYGPIIQSNKSINTWFPPFKNWLMAGYMGVYTFSVIEVILFDNDEIAIACVHYMVSE